jgi:catalase
MEDKTQKTALSETIQAEENKVKAKQPAVAAKMATRKLSQAKPASDAKSVKKAAAPKKNEKQSHKKKNVRDSFSMPENEYTVLSEIKKKCLANGIAVKKSELLRVGLKSLGEMSLATLKKQLSKLDEIKVGRPAKSVK